MRLIDRAEVGPFVIGRRIQYRKVDGRTVQRPSKQFIAVYQDADGRERVESLGTDSQPEAISRAMALAERVTTSSTRNEPSPAATFTVAEMIRVYLDYSETKNLAPKTIAKYRSDLDKLRRFCLERRIELVDQIDERAYYRFASWLRENGPAPGKTYAPKTQYTALTILLQAVKWSWKHNYIEKYRLRGARLPHAKPSEQPVYTFEQVDAMIEHLDGIYADAVLILAHTGMRVNELVQLCWRDIIWRDDEPVKIHIRRGGSSDAPKDKDSRRVPVSPIIKPVLLRLSRHQERVIPGLRDRTLLSNLKRAAKAAGNGGRVHVHALRHTFISESLGAGVPYRLVLDWVGHGSSAVTDQYFHALDETSELAMNEFAERAASRRTR